MPLTTLKRKISNSLFSLFFTLLFVYVVLFEFILPINSILPKPSVLLDAIPSLISNYNFLFSYFYTISVIYLLMVLSYFLISISKKILVKFIASYPYIDRLFALNKYFVPLLITFLFNQWFGNNSIGEYIFVLTIYMGELKYKVFNLIKNNPDEYLNSAKSLGLNDNQIIDKVIWKVIQPNIIKAFIEKNVFMWSAVLLYEYICSTGGLGSIFRLAIEYNDLSIIIVLVIIVIISIKLFDYALDKIKNKYFYWET